MDTNALIDLVHEVQGELWVDKVNKTHRTDRLCQWVSTFHPEKLLCRIDGTRIKINLSTDAFSGRKQDRNPRNRQLFGGF